MRAGVHLAFRSPPGVVALRLIGRLTPHDAVALLEALRRFPPRDPILADCRQMAVPTPRDVTRVATRLSPPYPYAAPVSASILVPPQFAALRSVVARYFPGAGTYALHVCHSWHEAIDALGFDDRELPDWLGLDEQAAADQA